MATEMTTPSMQLPTIISTGHDNPYYGGFGGNGWAAGLGGLILGTMWGNGGFGGGFGGNAGAAANAVAASQDRTQIANAIEHVSDQVTQGTISNLQSAQSTQNAINASAMANVQAQNAGTMATMQGTAAISDKICCSTGRLSQEIDQTGDNITVALTDARVQSMQNTQAVKDSLCVINNNLISQGYENRLQNQSLAAQLQAQHAEIMAKSDMQHCQDRELMREIAAQATRDQLTQAQNTIAAQSAQINLTQQLQAQTMYLISQLAPAAAAARTSVTAGA